MMSNFSSSIQQIIKSRNFVLQLVSGLTLDRGPMFSFIVLRGDKVDDFNHRLVSEPEKVDLSREGIVMCSGLGEPSDELIKEIETQFHYVISLMESPSAK